MLMVLGCLLRHGCFLRFVAPRDTLLSRETMTAHICEIELRVTEPSWWRCRRKAGDWPWITTTQTSTAVGAPTGRASSLKAALQAGSCAYRPSRRKWPRARQRSDATSANGTSKVEHPLGQCAGLGQCRGNGDEGPCRVSYLACFNCCCRRSRVPDVLNGRRLHCSLRKSRVGGPKGH